MEKSYRAELTGVFGDPVDGNPTGVMEEAAYRLMNLNYRYLTIRVRDKDLAAAVEGARAFGMKGFNLTMPHKIAVIPYLDALTQAAELIGAVNTVVLQEGHLLGDNTDGKGFVRALSQEGISLKGKKITILGAGGVARAISVECALAGAKHITIINRSLERGRELAELIDEQTDTEAEYRPWVGEVKISEQTEILVQSTCVGLHPQGDQKPTLDYDTITREMTVCDVVFQPVQTLFLQEAKKRGARVISGLGMLVQQGALNFELWTGEKAPVECMYRTLYEEL